MTAKIFREERLRLIMELIFNQKKVVVDELAEKFGRSASSIRLDLAELENRRLITRTHGGAILSEKINSQYVIGKNYLNLRVETKKEEKQRIALAVKDLINDGNSIMIDGGSTTYYVAKNLESKKGLTFITTSINLLQVFLEYPDAKIYLTGGLVHREFEDTIGEISVDSIQRFKPDCVITGVDAISIEHGLTLTDPSVAQIKKKMMSVCSRVIIVADSSKFGKVCLFHIADLKNVHTIVTDSNVPDEYQKYFIGKETNFIVA